MMFTTWPSTNAMRCQLPHMGQKQFATISHYSAGELCRHHLHHLHDELIIIPTPHYAPFGLSHTLNRES